MPATFEPHLCFGLRFRRADARVLRNVREWAAANRVEGDLSLYDKAAESAELGEPLVIHCTDRAEVEAMASQFAELNCKRPTIDDLNGG